MTRQMINDGSAYEKRNIRRAKVRRLTRWTGYLLFVLCLSAIWQERQLAPPVHDGMLLVSEKTMQYINENETLSNALVEFQEGYAQLLNDG